MPPKPPKSPVTIKKPRGINAPKKDVFVENVNEEFTSEFASIERELNTHRIGTFKVFSRDMTFNWSDGQNRQLAGESQAIALRSSMEAGIYRTDLQNRMSGIISKDKLKGNAYSASYKDGDKPLDVTDVSNSNQNAEYPVVVFKKSQFQIEMQSGQHRMKILQTMKKNASDHWWLVTVYDDSEPILLFSNDRTVGVCQKCASSK
jgi:hypothetical protein